MKKVCISSKNYNLTKGNEYKIITELEGFVSVINDKGLVRNYSGRLFKEVEEKPVLTVEDVNYDVNILGEDLNLDIKLGKHIVSDEISFSTEWVAENCGIRAISPINSIYSFIEQAINKFEELSEADRRSLLHSIFTQFMEEAIKGAEDAQKAMLLFSTNNDYPIIWNVLDEYADVVTEPKVNPDSGKDIKIWIIYLNPDFNEEGMLELDDE